MKKAQILYVQVTFNGLVKFILLKSIYFIIIISKFIYFSNILISCYKCINIM